jgi:hypothetical protein
VRNRNKEEKIADPKISIKVGILDYYSNQSVGKRDARCGATSSGAALFCLVYRVTRMLPRVYPVMFCPETGYRRKLYVSR